MNNYGPPEKVYVANDWYDGPRAGVADIKGLLHRFKSLFDEKDDEYLGTFMIWPIDEESLNLEIEQWCIFVNWNFLYESGEADVESHPGNGGINRRWDEIEMLLKKSRSEIPADAQKAVAEIEDIKRENRYEFDGPKYMMCWCVP